MAAHSFPKKASTKGRSASSAGRAKATKRGANRKVKRAPMTSRRGR